MQNFIVIFQPNGIKKFLTETIAAENFVDAAIIFERENNEAIIFQITLIS